MRIKKIHLLKSLLFSSQNIYLNANEIGVLRNLLGFGVVVKIVRLFLYNIIRL